MENTKQKIERASEYYAHNYFDMHETNSYKELKKGFEAGVEWAIKNISIMGKESESDTEERTEYNLPVNQNLTEDKNEMELKTAIEILDYHQEWRLGKRDDMIHEPKKLTEALDIVLSEVKKLIITV